MTLTVAWRQVGSSNMTTGPLTWFHLFHPPYLHTITSIFSKFTPAILYMSTRHPPLLPAFIISWLVTFLHICSPSLYKSNSTVHNVQLVFTLCQTLELAWFPYLSQSLSYFSSLDLHLLPPACPWPPSASVCSFGLTFCSLKWGCKDLEFT